MNRRDQQLEAVADLTKQIARLEQRREQAVARALHHGATFDALADALGVTRQAAHKHYRRIHWDPTNRVAWHEPPLPGMPS